MMDLLTDPHGFFEAEAESPSLTGPTLVVLLVAVIGIVGSLPVLQATTAVMPDEAAIFSTAIYASGVVGGIIGVLVVWLLYTVGFHVVSAVVFGADGSFRDTLALTGWGFIPRIPEGIIAAAVTYIAFTGVTLPSDPRQVSLFVQQLQQDPLFQLTSWLTLMFLAWSAMLWTFAMQHGRELSLREASLTVAVPVGVRVLLFLLSRLQVF